MSEFDDFQRQLAQMKRELDAHNKAEDERYARRTEKEVRAGTASLGTESQQSAEDFRKIMVTEIVRNGLPSTRPLITSCKTNCAPVHI